MWTWVVLLSESANLLHNVKTLFLIGQVNWTDKSGRTKASFLPAEMNCIFSPTEGTKVLWVWYSVSVNLRWKRVKTFFYYTHKKVKMTWHHELRVTATCWAPHLLREKLLQGICSSCSSAQEALCIFFFFSTPWQKQGTVSLSLVSLTLMTAGKHSGRTTYCAHNKFKVSRAWKPFFFSICCLLRVCISKA